MSIEPIVTMLKAVKEKDLAIQLLETLHKHAFHFEQYDDLAKAAFKMKEYQLAIKYAEDALTNALTNEKMWVGRSNLINLYNHANYPELALRMIKANEAVIPDDTDTRLEKAFSLYLMNRRDEAEAILKKELDRPDLTEEVRTKIYFNLGTYELYRDNFQHGLKLFQIEGQKLDFWKKPKLRGEFWEGKPAEGRTIVVCAEAGIGDEFINVRFMKHLKDRGMHPVWFTERNDLAKIFRNSGFDVITSEKDIPPNSLWTHSMTLPLSLSLSYDDLWYGPYIKSPAAEPVKFEDKQLKTIGLRWQGNPEYDQDLHRSVPLKDIMTAIPKNTNLVSLQKDTGLEELDPYPQIMNMNDYMGDFEDTLGIISNLDIVITTCTSVAHAAASMGKRTFIFVPLSAYYIWSHSTKQSPWYGDNVTLLRQTKPRVWDEPIDELRQYLNNM